MSSASIRRIDYGAKGQLLGKVASVPKALSYKLRYAAQGTDGLPGPWSSQPITTVLTPTACDGLTPGVNYVFQVRALGRLGYYRLERFHLEDEYVIHGGSPSGGPAARLQIQ